MPGSNIGNIFGTIRMKNDMLKRDLRASGNAVKKFTLTSSTQMKTLGASVVGVSKKLLNMRNLLIGGGAFLLFRSAIKEAVAFENALTKVATLVDDTSLVFGDFKKSIKGMSLEFGQSKETLSKGLFDIISATIDTADAMEVLRASTQLAVAGFTETGTATSAIITIFQTFKDELKGAEDASDLLFATMKRGRLTVEDVASNIGVVASVAKGAGVSVEDLSAAFSSISRSGVGAQKTVVQLLAFINSFTGANDDARDAARLLGTEMSATSIAGGKLIPTVLKMRDALNKMSVDMKANTIKAMFPNRRAQQAFNTLLIQGEATLEDYNQALNRSGLTQQALEKVMGKSAFQFMRFGEAIKALMDAFGEGLLPIVTAVAKNITDFVISLEDSGTLHRFTIEVQELGRQFKFLFGFIKDVSGAVNRSVNEITDLIAASKGDVANILGVRVGGAEFATAELTRAPEALSSRVRLGKIGGEETKKILEGLKSQLEEAKKIGDKLLDDLKAKAQGIAESVRTPFEIMEDKYGELVELVNRGLIDEDIFRKANAKIVEEFKSTLDKMKKPLEDFQKFRDQINLTSKELAIKNFNEELNEFKRTLGSKAATEKEFRDLRVKGLKKLESKFKETNVFLEQLARDAASSMHSAFEDLFFRSMKNDWEDFGDFMTSFWDSVLRSLSSALSTWIIGDLQKQLNVGVQSFTGAGGGAGGLLSGIKSFFGFAHGGIITKPTLFPMANGAMGIAREAGRDEAILPLTRIGADLGVKSTGMGDKEFKVEFNIINQTGIEITGEVESITKTPDRIIGEMVLRRRVKSRKFRDAMGV